MQEVRRRHARLLKDKKHLKYMWIPYTDKVVVTTCNPIKPVGCPLPMLMQGMQGLRLHHHHTARLCICDAKTRSRGRACPAVIVAPKESIKVTGGFFLRFLQSHMPYWALSGDSLRGSTIFSALFGLNEPISFETNIHDFGSHHECDHVTFNISQSDHPQLGAPGHPAVRGC